MPAFLIKKIFHLNYNFLQNNSTSFLYSFSLHIQRHGYLNILELIGVQPEKVSNLADCINLQKLAFLQDQSRLSALPSYFP